MENNDKFHYSMEFEMTMRLILGDVMYHCAGLASNPKFVKRAMKKALKKIRQRIDNIITMDERLRMMLFLEINALEEEVSKIDKGNNTLEVMSRTLDIIARLLGYDWLRGKVCREVVYYRTKEQEARDYRNKSPLKNKYANWFKERESIYLHRAKIILELKKKDFNLNEIARIMNTSEYAVKQIIKEDLLFKIIELKEKGLKESEIEKKLGVDFLDVIGTINGVVNLLSQKTKKQIKKEI